jgi:hypothetical protein
MDHYSFQGPYAYRWLHDVPVERIDLRSGERRRLLLSPRCSGPRPPGGGNGGIEPEEPRALMAAWN